MREGAQHGDQPPEGNSVLSTAIPYFFDRLLNLLASFGEAFHLPPPEGAWHPEPLIIKFGSLVVLPAITFVLRLSPKNPSVLPLFITRPILPS